MFKKPLWQTVWTHQTAPVGAVCFGSTLFASILNSSVMLGNYLQQTTSADDIFRCIFLGALRVNTTTSKSVLPGSAVGPIMYVPMIKVGRMQIFFMIPFITSIKVTGCTEKNS